jgi:hypothetical protein
MSIMYVVVALAMVGLWWLWIKWMKPLYREDLRRMYREFDQDILDGDSSPDADFLRRNPWFKGTFIDIRDGHRNLENERWFEENMQYDEAAEISFTRRSPLYVAPDDLTLTH